jgi:hypothetical protein
MNQMTELREQCAKIVDRFVGTEQIAAEIRALRLPESNASPCEAMHIGFDYLDNGQLVATYALPVRAEVAPKLYTSLTDWDALRKENEELKEQLETERMRLAGCGVGAEIADKIRALPVLAENPIKDVTEHLCELFGKAQEIFRDQIRQRLLEHGFTIKEGQTDLKPYVYDAVYAVLGDVVLPIIDKLQAAENQLETERMRLAGCGVAANMNTADSIKDRITRDNPYWSASYGDVCSLVDREIALRDENEQLKKGIASAQSAIEVLMEYVHTPEANCRCHISPPCNDCVDYGKQREDIDYAKTIDAELCALLKGGAA